jgi:hypothetical protein
MRASKFVIKYYLGDKEQQVGTACNIFFLGGGGGAPGAMHKRCVFGNLKERDYLEDIGLNAGVILQCAFNK